MTSLNLANTVELRKLQVWARLNRLRAAREVTQLKQRLRAAEHLVVKAHRRGEHIACLRDWRSRTGRTEGDPIADLADVIDDAINVSQWRLDRIEQSVEPDDEWTSIITLVLTTPERRIEAVFKPAYAFKEVEGQIKRPDVIGAHIINEPVYHIEAEDLMTPNKETALSILLQPESSNVVIGFFVRGMIWSLTEEKL